MPIDYARMKKLYPQQKRRLTVAVNTHDPQKVIDACRQAVKEWNEIGAWPDDWSRWERALHDVQFTLPRDHPDRYLNLEDFE